MKDYIKLVSLSVVLLIVSCKGETQKEETQPTDTKEVVILPENLGGQFRLELGGQCAPKSMVNLDWKVVVNLTVFSLREYRKLSCHYSSRATQSYNKCICLHIRASRLFPPENTFGSNAVPLYASINFNNRQRVKCSVFKWVHFSVDFLIEFNSQS